MRASTFIRCACALSLAPVARAAISPKAVIIDFYSGEQNAWLGIPEFNLLERNVSLPGLSMLFPSVHCTADGSVCQLVTGEGEINAAGSTLALVLSPEFNLTQTYFLLAGVAGISPELGTLGTVAFAQFAVQVALQYEFDAREKPDNFSTGYVPQGTTAIDSYPQFIYGTEVFRLNDALRQRAMAFAQTATLSDTEDAQRYRAKYANASGFAPAAAPPTIVGCDTATSDNWWSGALLGQAFENYTKLATNGTATYCTTQQEDNGVLEALLRGHVARRVDFARVMDMRTGSDFDRPPPGVTAADNLFNGMLGEPPALRNMYLAGVKVVQGIITGWDDTFKAGISAQNYVGDVLGSLGGSPSFGPGSFFNNAGAPSMANATETESQTSAATHAWSTTSPLVLFAFMLGASCGVLLRVP